MSHEPHHAPGGTRPIALLLITEDDSGPSAAAWACMLAGVSLIFASATSAYLGWFGERVPATVTAVEWCGDDGCQERIRFAADADGRDLGWVSSCGEVMRVGERARFVVDPLGLVAAEHDRCTASGWLYLMPIGGLLLFAIGPAVLVIRQVGRLAPTDPPGDGDGGWS